MYKSKDWCERNQIGAEFSYEEERKPTIWWNLVVRLRSMGWFEEFFFTFSRFLFQSYFFAPDSNSNKSAFFHLPKNQFCIFPCKCGPRSLFSFTPIIQAMWKNTIFSSLGQIFREIVLLSRCLPDKCFDWKIWLIVSNFVFFDIVQLWKTDHFFPNCHRNQTLKSYKRALKGLASDITKESTLPKKSVIFF